MKIRIIVLLAASALITLSFTFSSTNLGDRNIKNTEPTHTTDAIKPANGFLSDDKI